MKRLSFLKALLSLPFWGYGLAQKLKSKSGKPQYLLDKFFVAGFQYYKGPSLISQIQEGEELRLLAKPNNQYDTFAVEIYRKGTLLGHIPQADNKHISRLLQQDVKLHCFVAKVNPEQETWEMLKAEVYL